MSDLEELVERLHAEASASRRQQQEQSGSHEAEEARHEAMKRVVHEAGKQARQGLDPDNDV